MKQHNKYGFTLIELLVVVIIIAVLAAVAVPQYKHAVLKNRFSTVMPMAKSIAQAQEVYYLGKGYYAQEDEKDELDVTPVTAENTTVTLSETDGYDYVMAQNSKVPGAHYIMYQKHSENYPGEIHCEAEEDNADAQWLCGALSNNNSIGETVTEGYTTYIIDGAGVGFPMGYNALLAARVDCTGAEAMGLTCTSDAKTGVKKICTTVKSTNICRTRTYNEDDSYTIVTCKTNGEGVCTSSWLFAAYDANGNQLKTRSCSDANIDSNGNCTSYNNDGYDYTYDENGNKLSQRLCRSYYSNGNCSSYYNNTYNWTYDENGNMLSQRMCTSFDSNGTCTAYGSGGAQNFTYDANGKVLTSRTCSSVDSSTGNCTVYSSGRDYTYDANGTTARLCQSGSVDSSGNCAAYISIDNYTYDGYGNVLTHRSCSGSAINSNGNCTSYPAYYDYKYEYTYDDNGNVLSQRECDRNRRNSSGKCTSYDYTGNYDYTYDTNGNRLAEQQCGTVNNSTGQCTAYSGVMRDYTYDDNGKQISSQYCGNTNQINAATGECYTYTSISVAY